MKLLWKRPRSFKPFSPIMNGEDNTIKADSSKTNKLSRLVWMVLIAAPLVAQPSAERLNDYGMLFKTGFTSASFPHPARANGYRYQEKQYDAARHYQDSTVAIFIPAGFQPQVRLDFVVHFHGWWNQVDSVLATFKLIEQFAASRKNAVLVVPQGPKNAPDSFGGKLEEPGGFQRFMQEVMARLAAKLQLESTTLGEVILSGHSGGYRVIAFILAQGGLTHHIREVFLFDGLYAQIQSYADWFARGDTKFINIYTEHGGTKDDSESLMAQLQHAGTPFLFTPELAVTAENLTANRLLFIFSDLEHNEVIHVRQQFQKFLQASCLNDLTN